MRVVIDIQGAQTESRYRGIGRYTVSFVQAVLRHRGEHEIILALSGAFPETIASLRETFPELPRENIRVWEVPCPVREEQHGNELRREAAEMMREEFLASLLPDIIHVASLFEGYTDDAVTSIGRLNRTTPVSVMLYDLIPLLNPEQYLLPGSRYTSYYHGKIEHLRRASIYLAISESSCEEGVRHLGISSDRIVNISAGVDVHFQQQETCNSGLAGRKFGLTRPFILYTGGADQRKNLPRLIRAFAALPKSLREAHHLLLAGRMSEDVVLSLQHVAESSGLLPGELCFTGYISDEDLLLLYNSCRLFVFPSWHEGFGLPPLEAMACGAPVIGANTSSLPEVIGCAEALFDPFDVAAIADKIRQVLEDEKLLERLRENGLKQVGLFSWDDTGKRAIAAWESLHDTSLMGSAEAGQASVQAELISALAGCIDDDNDANLPRFAECIARNRSSGIERQLMLDVSELSQQDAATGVQRVVRSYLLHLLKSPPRGFRVEPVYATQNQGYRYARRFVQGFLGETGAMDDEPIQWQRGDIFFGLDMQHHVQLAQRDFFSLLRIEGVTVKFLVYDLLPIQLADFFRDDKASSLHAAWLSLIATQDGAICISRATAEAYDTWLLENGIPRTPGFQMTWVHIGGDIEHSRPSRGLPPDAPSVLDALRARSTFLCVSTLEPRKAQGQILDAVQLLWNEGMDINLVLVGSQGWKTEELAEKIRNHPERGLRLFWLEGISDEYLEKVYQSSSCLVAASINEGFGLPLIEAARHALPVIARDIPVFREVATDHAYYFSGDRPSDLASALKGWLELAGMGKHPDSRSIPWLTWTESSEKLKAALVGEHYPRRQLLVDISELVQRDARSGIQRVVRSILKEWLLVPPEGYRIEPVFATNEQSYCYARKFTARFMGASEQDLLDDAIDYAPGDIFFGLDFQPQVVVAQRRFYQELRRKGVSVKFLLHDLLCIRQPEYFPPGSAEGFARWLDVVAENDGAVCVSRTVAQDLECWLREHGGARAGFEIDWSHNGADIGNSDPSKGLPPDADALLQICHTRTTFLMVGTLEPRKGHAQVLDAFESLWANGDKAILVIVGKQGWMVDDLIVRLRGHAASGVSLFWLEAISDEYLEKVYAASACLIAASYGEGFGLPLIEAAQHELPIIARDIPVFREVAGEHAFYFRGEGESLADALKEWMHLNAEGMAPLSSGMFSLTWKQSAQRLMQICVCAPQQSK